MLPITTIGVQVGLGVAVGVGVGVGDGKPVPVPLIRNTLSGTPGSMPHVAPLCPQVMHTPKLPPGFCHAAGELDCTVRSVQPHSPCVAKVILAWISIQ